MNNTIKKVLKVVLIILSLLILALIIYMGALHFDGFLDKSNPMTKEEVISLLEKGKEYPNYYYSPREKIGNSTDKDITEIYIKDNVKKVVFNKETLSWSNYNTDEEIHLTEYHEKTNKKYAFITKMSENGALEVTQYSQMGFDYSLIADTEHFDYNFKYLGEKQIKNRTCILVKVWNKEAPEIMNTKFIIDKETGLITERIDYTFYGILPMKIICDRNLKLDVVTEEEMARPDLTGYEVIQ